MAIDSIVGEQLEFSFLDKIRMQLYAKKQGEEMAQLYKIFVLDGTHAKDMRYGDFLQHIWIKGKYAERFHKNNHYKYFYDTPIYKGKTITP